MEIKSKSSWACKFVSLLGFAVDETHKKASFWTFIKWFFWDYKNNIFFQLSRNNYLFGSSISIQFLRPILNRMRGARIGKHVAISEGAIVGLTYANYVTIGDNCRISANVIINEHGRYLKGYGPNVPLLDLPVYKKPVVIEDDCHIGLGAIILPGVTIGKGSIVGAGAVVRESVPPYSLVIGNPAKVVKRFGLPSEEQSNVTTKKPN